MKTEAHYVNWFNNEMTYSIALHNKSSICLKYEASKLKIYMTLLAIIDYSDLPLAR